MKRYVWYGLVILVMAVLPSLHVLPSLTVYDEKRLFQVILLGITGLLFIKMESTSRVASGWPGILGIGLFLGLGLLSMWVNGDWYHGLQELSLYILLIAFFLYTAGMFVNSRHSITPNDSMADEGNIFEKGVKLLLLVCGGLYTLKFFIGYGMHLFIDYPLWPGSGLKTSFFGFANVRFFNQLQVWTLPLFVMWALEQALPVSLKQKNPRRLRKFWKPSGFGMYYSFFFLASLWWCLIIESAGRGATLSLLMAPIIVLLIYKEQAHGYIKKYLWAFFTGVVLKILFFDILAGGEVTKTVFDGNSSGRLATWYNAILGILEKPFLGYGPMSIANTDGFTFLAHPHNSILQIAYEYGLPAMLLVFGLVVWGLYRWFKQGQSAENQASGRSMLCLKNIRIGLSTSLLAGLGYSLFSGVIVMPLSQLWMSLVAGWALGMYYNTVDMHRGGDSKDLSDFQNMTGLFGKGMVFAAVIFMSYSLIQEVPHLKENQQHYIERHVGKFHPRFWQQGKIELDEQRLP